MYCDLWSQYIQVRKLFKGGNYSRAETIRGSTVIPYSSRLLTLINSIKSIGKGAIYDHVPILPLQFTWSFDAKAKFTKNRTEISWVLPFWAVTENFFSLLNYVTLESMCSRVANVVAHHDELLTQWRYIWMSKLGTNIFLISTTSNYLRS